MSWENVFEYEGQPGHEIVFVFDAHFCDLSLYGKESIPIIEEDVWLGPARWIDLAEGIDVRLYPEGLMELLGT